MYKKTAYRNKKSDSGRKNQKKKYYKYNPKAGALTTQVKGVGFSDVMYVKLKYAESINMVGSGAPYAPYIFRGNSLYDPNYSGVGHQPLYYDQYCEIYNKYRVFGASIKLTISNTSATSAVYFVVEPNTEINTFVDTYKILEQNRAKQTMIISPGQLFTRRIKEYCTTRKVCGITKAQMDDTYTGTVTTNPAEVWYFNLFASSVDGITTPNLDLMVEITYYAEFFDRKQIPTS